MSNAESIYQKAQSLDEPHLQELADFLDFLLSKQASRLKENAESITVSAKEWERLQETLYVLQNQSLMQQIADSMKTWQTGKGYTPTQEEMDALD